MRSLVCFLVMVACSTAPRPPVDTPIAVAPAPIAPERPAPECSVDADCAKKPRPPQTSAVCEANRCAAWTRDQLRAWAASSGVVLPLSVPEPPGLADVSWIDKKKPNLLYADGALFWPDAKKCVALKLEWQEPTLVGAVAATYGQNPEGNGVVVYSLQLSTSVILSGPGSLTKHKDGTTSGWGVGEARQLGRQLAPPFDNALRYDGLRVKKTVLCPKTNLQTDPRCAPCLRCDKYLVTDTAVEALMGFGVSWPTVKVQPSGEPSCVACPADGGMADKLARFDLLTAPLETLAEERAPGAPAFYRKLTDCETARKTKPAPGA